MSFSAADIAALQTTLTVRWHEAPPPPASLPSNASTPGDTKTGGPAKERDDFNHLVTQNHLRNFLLWHEEDIARRDDLGFESVYRAKRAIDRFNQERNNCIEQIDQAIAEVLRPVETGLPRNSETPGMIIDRLSILALKEFHMHEETVRSDASAAHREQCAAKLARIRLQRSDLIACLAEFFADLIARRRTFRVYFQFKMYNDPALNPQLYRSAPKG